MKVPPSTICIYCAFFQKENEYTNEIIDYCNSHMCSIHHIDACLRFQLKQGITLSDNEKKNLKLIWERMKKSQ